MRPIEPATELDLEIRLLVGRRGDIVQAQTQRLSRMRDQSPGYRLLAASCAMLGDSEAADLYVRKAKEIHPDFRVTGRVARCR